MDFENELNFEYTSQKQDYLLSLLDSSSFEGKHRDAVERDIQRDSVGFAEFNTLKQDLINAQVDRIDAGFPYNASDIRRKINKFITAN